MEHRARHRRRPDERVSFRLELEPGGEHSEHLAVTNHSEREVSFELTASDGVVSAAGDFGLLPEDPTGSGAWIDVPGDVTVPAGQSAVVPFTISVPEDALPTSASTSRPTPAPVTTRAPSTSCSSRRLTS